MPLQKLQFKPGVDRENTRYAAEGGWYETNKVRFRRGMPQKIGGWVRLSSATFLGICRSMLNWVTLQGQNLVSVGTNLKYYIERGGAYYDITPIRSTVTLTNPFDTTDGSAVVLVTDLAHGALEGDFVTFSGATAVGGLTLNNEYQISLIDEDSYNITAETTASSTATGGALLLRHTKSTRVTRLLCLLLAGLRVLGVLAHGVLAVLLMPLFGCGVSLTSVRTYSLPTVAERLFTGMLPTE
jgi:hypothetical protein